MALSEKHIHILQKAEKLFSIKGYDATTVRDIAESAEVNPAMISYYFGSKEKLLEVLFAERMAIGISRVKEIEALKTLNPWQKLQILVDEYINRALQKQDFYKIMIIEQVTNKNPAVLNYIKDLRLVYVELIGNIIKEGQKKKIFCKKVDIAMLLTTMTGTVMHMLINQEFYQQALNVPNMPEKEFHANLTKNLQHHIKTIFRAILEYEST